MYRIESRLRAGRQSHRGSTARRVMGPTQPLIEGLSPATERPGTEVISALHFDSHTIMNTWRCTPAHRTFSQLQLCTGPTLPSRSNSPLSQITVRTRARHVTCSRGDLPWFYHVLDKPSGRSLALHGTSCLVTRLQSQGHRRHHDITLLVTRLQSPGHRKRISVQQAYIGMACFNRTSLPSAVVFKSPFNRLIISITLKASKILSLISVARIYRRNSIQRTSEKFWRLCFLLSNHLTKYVSFFFRTHPRKRLELFRQFHSTCVRKRMQVFA